MRCRYYAMVMPLRVYADLLFYAAQERYAYGALRR